MAVDYARPRASRQGIFGSRAAFTLVELLVVVAIISILAALLLPMMAKARATAKQVACVSNQKQIGFAVLSYADANRGWLPNSNGPTNPIMYDVSWRYQIASYLGCTTEGNPRNFIGDGVFRCPAWRMRPELSGIIGYAPNYHPYWGGLGWNCKYMGYNDWVDGAGVLHIDRRRVSGISRPSVSILLGDGTDWYSNPADPAGYSYQMQLLLSPSNTNVLPPVGNRHNDGICAAYADAHVAWNSQNMLMLGNPGDIDWYYRDKGGPLSK